MEKIVLSSLFVAVFFTANAGQLADSAASPRTGSNLAIGAIDNAGQPYHFGQVTIQQDFLDDDVFERFLTFKPGDSYSDEQLVQTQRDLYASDYVEDLDIVAAPEQASKAVPVKVNIQPKANKHHRFAIGYGTDRGVHLKHSFDWRWVNRRGHQFKSDIDLSHSKQEAGVQYRIPAQRPVSDYYSLFAYGKRDVRDDVSSHLWNVGGDYRDQTGKWTRQVGLKWQQEDFTLGNDSDDTGVLAPFATLTYRLVGEPSQTEKGVWLKGKVTGANESLLSDVTFLQTVAELKASRTFAKAHKVQLTASAGRSWIDDFHQLPADYRFFSGGDYSIRGYRFASIGDRDSSGENIGGNKMHHISGEYEYFFNDHIAGALFVDAGDAYSSGDTSLKVGAGAGVRYYSPIGPVRLDMAHGFDEPGDDFRLHFNVGKEF